MEVSPFLFKWLVELNIIEQNEKDNFISDDIIYLLCGGKYFDRILYSFQNAYNKYYKLHLDFLERLKDLNPISIGQKNIQYIIRYNNWKIIFDLLSHFGINYNENDLNTISNGDKYFLIEILHKINTYYNKFLTNQNIENEINDNIDNFSDINSIESFNINNIDINKKYEYCNSPYELFLISLCRNFKVSIKQSEKLLSSNRKFLSIICNKGINNSFEPIKNWLRDLDLNINTIIKILKKYPQEKHLGYEIIGIALCCKENEILMKCIDILNKLKNQIGNNWEWLCKEGIDSFIFTIIKNKDKKLNMLNMLYEFIKSNLNDFFIELRKRIANKQRKKIYDFYSSIFPIIKKTNFIFCKQLQKFLLDITLNDNEDFSFSASILGEAFYYLFPIDNNISNSIINYFKACIRNKKENVYVVGISHCFKLMEKFCEIQNNFAPLFYNLIVSLFIDDYNILYKREFILLNFDKFYRNYQKVPIDILLEPYLDLILNINNYSLCDFNFIIKIISHPKIKFKELKLIIEFCLNVILKDIVYNKTANLIINVIFINQIIENRCTESQIYEFEEIFIDFIRKCFNLYINSINQNENKILLETPYEIMNLNFRNVNKRIFNDLIESIKKYRKKKDQNSNALIAILQLYDNYNIILKDINDDYIKNNEPIKIETVNLTEIKEIRKIIEEYQLKNIYNDDINENNINNKEISINNNNIKKETKKPILKNQFRQNNNYQSQKNIKKKKLKEEENTILKKEKDKKKNISEKYNKLAKIIKNPPPKFPSNIIPNEEEEEEDEDQKFEFENISENSKQIGKNFITIGQLNSNLSYAINEAKLNLKKKNNYIKPKYINKFEEENDYFKDYFWELTTDEKDEQIKNEEEKKLLNKMQKSISIILPEYTVIKDIEKEKKYKKKNNDNENNENIDKKNIINIENFDEFFPIPINIQNEEDREIKAIEIYYNNYLKNIKMIFRDYSNDINKKMKKSNLLKLFRDKGYDNKQLNIHEFNLTLLKIFGEKIIEITYEQFTQFLIQISYVIETKVKNTFTLCECYERLLKNLFTNDINYSLAKIYKKMKPVIKLIKYNIKKNKDFNLPPGFKIIEKTNILYKNKLPESILNTIGESKYICYQIIQEIILKKFNSNLIEPYVGFKDYNDIEIDPLIIHNWNPELTISYMNLDIEYKKIGIEICDILEEGLEKICKNRDNKGNILKNTIMKKKEKEKINNLEIEKKNENERYKRRLFLKKKVEKYQIHKQDVLKKKIENEQNEREKIINEINSNPKFNEKFMEQLKQIKIKKNIKNDNTLIKPDISYLNENKEYYEFEKNLNSIISNLLNQKDIKNVIETYKKHFKLIYEIYSKIGVKKITFHNTETIHLNEFKEFLTNFSILRLLISTDQVSYIFNKLSKKTEEQSYLTYDDFLMSIIYLSIFSKFANRSRKLLPEDIEKTDSNTIENFIQFLGFKLPFNRIELESFINDRRAMKYKDLIKVHKNIKKDINEIKKSEIKKEKEKNKEMKKEIVLKEKILEAKKSEEREKKYYKELKIEENKIINDIDN